MLSSWIIPIVLAMSSSATAAVARVTPSYFQKRCEKFQYDAGSVHLGSFCVIGVGPPRLMERQTGIGVSGLGFLPEVFFVNENGEHRTSVPCSVDPQDVSGGGKGFTRLLETISPVDHSQALAISTPLNLMEVMITP